MNRYEFLNTLRDALSGLPADERANAMRYYEDYFLDAGGVDEAEVIAQLGDPRKIADDILSQYRELTVREQARGRARYAEERARQANRTNSAPDADGEKPRRRGISPGLLVVLLLLALFIGIPFGLPVLILLVVLVLCLPLVLAILAAAAVVVMAAVPFALCIAGGAMVVFSFSLWAAPASAVCTMGTGLAVLAAGLLLGLLCIKLLTLFVPPLFRGVVAILRWPIDRLRGVS